jgi:hypothetical protein
VPSAKLTKQGIVAGIAAVVFGGGVLVGHYAIPNGDDESSLPAPVPVRPGSGSPVSTVGATVTLTGTGGAELAVTLRNYLPHPQGGDRLVQLDLTLANVGSSPVKVQPGTQALVIDTSGQTYSGSTSAAASVNCRSFASKTYSLAGDRSLAGCVVVRVPASTTVGRVEYVPTGPHFPSGTAAAIWGIT